MKVEKGLDFSEFADAEDGLRGIREEFLFPRNSKGEEYLYFTGNSLGLQPKKTKELVLNELEDWGKLGVEGHLKGRKPWYSYHELVAESLAKLCGSKSNEIVAMNSLTVNLHLALASFYQPKGNRNKIVMEESSFPSDIYAIKSQIKFHGLNPDESLIFLKPRAGERLLRTDDILETIRLNRESISLVLLGQVNYLTGQAFDSKTLVKATHDAGAFLGLDLAHGIGNLKLNLHDDGVDFAVWCSYKYLNSGPGAIAGLFVHEKHKDWTGPRLEGWWGHDKSRRFEMRPVFSAIGGAESWQLSNPPILQLASLRASLDIFDKVPQEKLQEKTRCLTGYLEFLLNDYSKLRLVTPANSEDRGCQLSYVYEGDVKRIQERLFEKNIVCDIRAPDILRVAPVPLYTRYRDVYQFSQVLREL